MIFHSDHTPRISHFLVAISSALIFLTMFTAMVLLPSSDTGVKNQRTVKFNHEYHLKEVGADCTDCHTGAKESVVASDNLLAKMSACKSCHEDKVTSECTFCHSTADTATYTATPNPQRDIVFNHRLHVDDKKIACQTCHTNLDRNDVPVGEIVPSMEACTTCHNGVKATNECAACHKNFASLRPKDHNRTDFIHEHKRLARMQNATCSMCHSQENCADCHNGAGLVKVTLPGKDLVSPLAPRLNALDRGQGMTLTKVHNLNYKFTHGIEAKGKSAECQSCHSYEDFCSTCHHAGGNVNQGSFKPASHSVAGFTTFGVGSGGGEHARQARMDIESCAGCHGEIGGDPVCITCHVDPDGVQHTNPKTHDHGFMSDTHGPWHTDPGATCYMCHTDANAHPGGMKGQKFCGYCHAR